MTIKNFKSSEKSKEFFKKNKIRLMAIGVAITLATGAAVAVIKGKSYIEQKNNISIVEHYGSDSKEVDVLEYLKISEKLHDLGLDNYKIADNLFDQYGISNNLKSSGEINDLINKFEKIKDRDENLVAQSDDINTILNLVKQESLVNKYIYTTGYNVANTAVESSLQEYANVHYGLLPEATEFSASVVGGDKSTLITDGYKNVRIDNFFPNHIENVIMNGITHLDNTNKFKDPNSNDNNDYNKERNKNIKEALLFALGVNEEIAELENPKHQK